MTTSVYFTQGDMFAVWKNMKASTTYNMYGPFRDRRGDMWLALRESDARENQTMYPAKVERQPKSLLRAVVR